VVVRVERNAFVVRNLATGKEMAVHGSRLKFYADKDLNITEELRQHISSQNEILDVQELLDHRWSDRAKDFELKVSWVGLEVIEDSWEPLKSMMKDVPKIVEDYVNTTDDEQLKRFHSRRTSREDTEARTDGGL
jgi:hypothetical protein